MVFDKSCNDIIRCCDKHSLLFGFEKFLLKALLNCWYIYCVEAVLANEMQVII